MAFFLFTCTITLPLTLLIREILPPIPIVTVTAAAGQDDISGTNVAVFGRFS